MAMSPPWCISMTSPRISRSSPSGNSRTAWMSRVMWSASSAKMTISRTTWLLPIRIVLISPVRPPRSPMTVSRRPRTPGLSGQKEFPEGGHVAEGDGQEADQDEVLPLGRDVADVQPHPLGGHPEGELQDLGDVQLPLQVGGQGLHAEEDRGQLFRLIALARGVDEHPLVVEKDGLDQVALADQVSGPVLIEGH